MKSKKKIKKKTGKVISESATASSSKGSPKKAKSRNSSSRKIRFAVVGLGSIAQMAVLPAFASVKNAELVALISSDSEKLKVLGKKYKVSFTATPEDFEDCLKLSQSDAVYIALPNSLHCAYALRAARMGLHVLCEKPMALKASEAESMIEVARKNQVRLMVAYRLHFEEANLKALHQAHQGELGELRLFQSSFTMQVRDRENIRLQHRTGGGPLWDLGIYCLNAARSVFRDEPIEVCAMTAAGEDPRFDEVEEMVSVILRFPGERLASFTASFGSADESSYEIIGTRGKIRVEPAFEYAEGLSFTLTKNEKEKTREYGKRDQFAAEITAFVEAVQNNKSIEASGEEGLHDVKIIEAIYRSAREGRSLRLSIPKRSSYPQLKMNRRKAPHDKPNLFRATNPSS